MRKIEITRFVRVPELPNQEVLSVFSCTKSVLLIKRNFARLNWIFLFKKNTDISIRNLE